MRKPFFKKSHGAWYVHHAGRMVRLAEDEEAAFDEWNKLRESAAEARGPNVSFRRLAGDFVKENIKPTRRFEEDERFIEGFCNAIGGKQVRHLARQDVLRWLEAPKPGPGGRLKGDKPRPADRQWSTRTKSDAWAAVKRVLAWGVQEGRIQRNPLAGFSVEAGRPRSAVIDSADHEKLFAAADKSLQQYLIAARSGARPRQIREVTARNVSADGKMWVFEEHKTRHKTNRPLVVYLTPELQKLTKQLVKQYPVGPLFRNSQGGEWKKDTVALKIKRLRETLGLPDTVIPYAYRHTFATDALLAGHSLATVAQLLGHTDTRMVGQVYGHLEHHRSHLIDAAASVNQAAKKAAKAAKKKAAKRSKRAAGRVS